MPSTLFEDTAPCTRLVPRARTALAYPGAQAQQLLGFPWPQELALGRSKGEHALVSINRSRVATNAEFIGHHALPDPFNLPLLVMNLLRIFYAAFRRCVACCVVQPMWDMCGRM